MTDKDQEMKQLVEKAAAGDNDAFALLYKMVYRDMYKMALYTLGNTHDAENAVSEAVTDAYAGLKKLRDPAAFRAWIFAILSNKCKAIQRDYVKNRDNTLDKPPEEYESVIGGEDPGIEAAEEKSVLQKAFSVLSEEERQIVSLTVYGELDSMEVAKRLSLNRNTVRSKYSRALKKMKAVLA